MRLIDAEALIKYFEENGYLPRFIRQGIEAQPTAYDVEKVVEQLESCPTRSISVLKAVKIVKGGAK